MAGTPQDRDSEPQGYEPPEVEDVSTEAGPAVTAAGDTPTDAEDVIAISLIEDHDERRP